MPEEFELQKLKEQYPEFFKEAPAKLVDLASSQKTASQISDICFNNGVEDEEKIEKIAYYISFVLLSQLPPGTLPKTLEREVKISAEIAQKISQEANQLIFSQVKNELSELYKEEFITGKSEKITPTSQSNEKPKRPSGKDVYRELIK